MKKNFLRGLFKNALPRSLFGRSLVIIITPLLLVQMISTYVFFDRHWESVTRQFSDNIAGQVKILLSLMEEESVPLKPLKEMAQNSFGVDLRLQPLPFSKFDLPSSLLSDPWGVTYLESALQQKLSRPFGIQVKEEVIKISLNTPKGGMECSLPIKRLVTKTTFIYILWSLGTSVLFLFIAILFMRNQIRPLGRLAEAAENFGKGREVSSFKPEGAIEVRKAGTAFIVMRERIGRYMSQRTEMLAGVSHDLRTPLTRMSLQLAMLPPGVEVQGLQKDVKEMEYMVEEYLAFARGEAQENQQSIVLLPFLKEIAAQFKELSIEFCVEETFHPSLKVMVKSHSLNRCISNILGNAQRYTPGHVKITLSKRNHFVILLLEDNGPGIPENQRRLVFKPFYRLEGSRNRETGGVGLGLTIAKDSVRSHGGNITLGTSEELGGLKVQIRLPI
jgi:two-component system osmolarity sensor histidine kinase EnvZ